MTVVGRWTKHREKEKGRAQTHRTKSILRSVSSSLILNSSVRHQQDLMVYNYSTNLATRQPANPWYVLSAESQWHMKKKTKCINVKNRRRCYSLAFPTSLVKCRLTAANHWALENNNPCRGEEEGKGRNRLKSKAKNIHFNVTKEIKFPFRNSFYCHVACVCRGRPIRMPIRQSIKQGQAQHAWVSCDIQHKWQRLGIYTKFPIDLTPEPRGMIRNEVLSFSLLVFCTIK